MRLLAVVIMGAAAFSTARAQDTLAHRAGGIQATLGPHHTAGSFIDNRDGALIDLLAVVDVRSAPRWSGVLAWGAGYVFGGFGDACLIKPDGGCAPEGNFTVFNVLGGVDMSVGKGGGRALVGPALYSGAGTTSVGVQGRVDLFSPTLANFALGLMLRTTALRSFDGAWLLASAAGGSIAIR